MAEFDQNIRPVEKVPRFTNEQVDPDEFGIIDGEEGRIEDETDFGDGKPFTGLETRILNTLHKYLDKDALAQLSQETPETYVKGNGAKFWNIMKMFGIEHRNDVVDDTRASKYAKWAYDNWTEEGDYGNIENPIKAPLKWYDIERSETGSQIEYKSGNAEVLGFDEDDASERADYDFYAWGGEMETHDWGDYEAYDSTVDGVEFTRMDEGLARVLREDMNTQKIQDLLFNYWRKFGPTLDPDKLKLLGFDMHSEEDKILVYNNLIEYYGDEELENIVHERLEGVHDADYQFIVTSYDSLTPRPYKTEERGLETYVDVLINGDQIIPIGQEDGTVRDMTVWEANEKAAEEQQENPYDDAYEGIREEIQYYLNDVILQNLPIEAHLDYVDFSEPGSFETYAEESLPKSAIEMITEDDDGYIDDMVYIDEPREKHIRRMGRGLGSLVGFPLDKYKNMPPPENESDTTEEEIEYLEDIPVDKNLVDSADELRKHFTKFLTPKGLEYPKQEMKEVMQGVKAIILILKYYYNRPRPWQIAQAKGLELNSETLQSSSSPSYPSGHATQGRFVARYLSDLYPEYRNELMQIGDDIAFSRNMAKVHYPSDSKFGKMLGDDMYDFITPNTITESVPKPGSSSAEGIKDDTLPYETEYLTLDEILTTVKSIPYYKEVLMDLRDDKDDWAVTQTVKRYAKYWMEHPESLTSESFPPIQVIGDGLKDGAHRISTLNALANHIDPDNSYWTDVKLEVRFYPTEIVKDIGPTWINGELVYNTDEGLQSKSLNEHKEVNPQLMVGDEIMVVSTEGVHDFGAPELYKPYVVVGIKHGTTMNREIHNWTHGEEDEEQTPDRWDSPEVQRSRLGFRKEFDTIPYTYYQIEPIGMTDEERTGAMLAGGGRMKPMYIFPSPNEYRGSDQWILRPGFLRGELNEGKNFDSIPLVDTLEYGETMNPKPNVGDKIILIDKEEDLQAFKENQPELFTPYVVVLKHDYNFQLVKVDEYDYWKGWVERGSDEVPSPQKIFYPLDYKWIDADTPRATNVDRKTISEHKELNISPDLEVDDVIRVIDVDGEHAKMPKRFGVYKVEDVRQDNATQQMYYALVPYPWEDLPDTDYIDHLVSTYGDPRGKFLYWGDTWIKIDKVISEQIETELNPELEVGDTIRVIDIDRERESGDMTYNTPPEELRPEMLTRYTVVKKESAGHKSQWPFKYIVVREDKVEEYEKNLERVGLRGGATWERLLFPWIYQWIYADKKTITEQKESNLNPELQIGDEIIVLDVGVEVKNDMNKPDKYIRYFVTKIYGNKELDIPLEDVPNHLFDTPEGPHYYGLNRPDVDVTDPDNPGVYDQSSTHKHLYPRTDTWMFNPKGPTMRYEDAFQPEVYMSDEEYEAQYDDDEMIYEHKEELNQPLTMGDIIRVVDVDKESEYKLVYPSGEPTTVSRGMLHGQDTYPTAMDFMRSCPRVCIEQMI